jgi:hypothetical protein
MSRRYHTKPILFVDPDGQHDYSALPSPRACPFCNNDGVTLSIWLRADPRDDGKTNWRTQCLRCHCEGPFELYVESAIASWNGARNPLLRESVLPAIPLETLTPMGSC